MRRSLSSVAATLLAIELLDELVFGAREAAWPLIRDDLDLSYAEIGLLLAVGNWTSVVIEPVVFVLGDVWRRRVLVLGGGVFFALALALAAGAASVWMLALAFALMYPASGAFVSLSQATLMDAEPERREENMTRWTIAGSVGAVAGPAALAVAVWLGGGWRETFAVFAVLSLALVALAARVPFTRPSLPDGVESPRARDVLAALRRRDVWRWLAAGEMSNLLLDVLLGFLAVYFVDEVRAGSAVGGAAVMTWVAAGLVGGVIVLRVLRRVDGLRYLRWSAWTSIVLFAAFLLLPGVVPKLAALALLGIVNAGWYPVTQARRYAALPEASGVALAVGTAADFPASFVPFLVGLAADEWGLDVALWLLLAAPLALLALVPRAGR